MRKRTIVILLGLVFLVGGWYAFRPERLFVNQTVSESFPTAPAAKTQAQSAEPTVLLSGHFHSVAHETSGTATLYQLPTGERILRFADFKTSNGPDVQVYLVAANDATDSDTVKKAGFIHLGALKGNQGDQNYTVPASADLNQYRAATVWCRRFGVNFGTAPLAQSEGAPRTLAQGRFHTVAHDSKGLATVYSLPDGRRVLRLTEFETSNGPDLQLYLVAANDAADSDAVKRAGFVSLGALKGNRGDQNYDVAANLDLTKYRAVTVWCRRFGVNFATAPLAQP